MLKNVVRICVFLALFSKVFCQSHLTQQDWDLASTINFRELAEYYQYGSTGCRVFKRGVQIQKDFCLRINIAKGNCWIMRIGLCNGKVSKSVKIWLLKLIFLSQNSFEFFSFFFHWMIQIICHWHFLITSIFCISLLVKSCPMFASFPLTQFLKFHYFLLVYWFLG